MMNKFHFYKSSIRKKEYWDIFCIESVRSYANLVPYVRVLNNTAI